MSEYNIFVPFDSEYTINSKLYHKYKNRHYYLSPNKKPFFSILNEGSAMKSFIDAVIDDRPEIARNYLSRIFGSIDLDIIRSIFKDKEYKYVRSAKKKSCGTVKSVVVSSRGKTKCIIHFHFIKEPDKFGMWKISKIVKES